MNRKELANIIKMAKESTEDVWGTIRYEQPSQGGEEWKENREKKIVIDNVAWRTYEIILGAFVRTPGSEKIFEAQQKMVEITGELLNLLKEKTEGIKKDLESDGR